ncbi:MAG: DNA topoisomerase I [Clostridiales bacterium GWF2_38_85]|nr:MAG: DNA topoisomerase I [Clostridiales bacterium GWF2_38_85]HBL83880.1 type I DNA topoisomerase [Clostridiales bacterium]
MSVLVILESPTKAPTVKNYLGKGYKVMASKGHVRDLPKSKFGVDIDNNFEPQYINIRGKGELINQLKKEAKLADVILLATDPDREGEAISWHIANVIGENRKKVKRITFNELTKTAIKAAIKIPRKIDMNLVNSQQARRILDRIVGYKISPLFWKNIKSGLSAGRVQSVATRLIVEREQEIRAFIPVEYWNLSAVLQNSNNAKLTAKFYGTESKKIELKTKEETDKVIVATEKSQFKVVSIKNAVKYKKPAPPFSTSAMQQEANKKLSFQSQRTMKVAQELYEGISLGDKGIQGLITYMRTDSLRISDEAREAVKNYITDIYGTEYYPSQPNIYKSKANIQDAHEAIRPSDVKLTPDLIKNKLSLDQYKLYKLIWERFVASQMANAQYDTIIADIESAGYIFRAGGYTIKFPGYLAATRDDLVEEDNGDDELQKGKLPKITENEILKLDEILKEQKYTQPPARYTEATFLKMLEEKGIGRPSTITPTIITIINRGYVKREGKTLFPTPLGEITTELMIKSFPDIVDYGFTAKMEEDLDKIEEGTENYLKVLQNFYDPFAKMLSEAEKTIGGIDKNSINPIEETDLICDNCGAKMIVKTGRYGKFAACPNYPQCKNIKPLKHKAENNEKEEVLSPEKCEKCGKDMVLKNSRYGQFYACKGFPECKNTRQVPRDTGAICPLCGKRILIKQGKSKTLFYSCEGYPDCKFSVWDQPLSDKCPKCDGLLLKSKKKKIIYCNDNKCGYSEKIEE